MATLYASADQIRREAAQLDPLKVLLTLVLIVPVLIGWTVRLAWVLFALLWTGVVQGWRICDRQVKAREAAARSG